MKQDLNGVRTPEDVVRRYDFKDIPILVESTKEIALQVKDKVDSDKIISSINLSPEGTQIKGDKISLEGQTINLTSKNIQIDSDNFKVDSYGNMTCNNATMQNAAIENGSINIVSEFTDSKFHLENSTYGTKVDIYPNLFAMRDDTHDCDFRIQQIGYLDLTQDIQINIKNESGETTKISGRYIETPVLYQTSSVDKKKDFEPLESGLDIVKNTDIYKYHFKSEKETDKKHVGFIIGENYKYRKELTDSENQRVDLYSMVSVLWRAVQEQQKEIEELKKKVEK